MICLSYIFHIVHIKRITAQRDRGGKKNIAETISTDIKEVIQNEIQESCICSPVVPVLQQHVKNLKQQNEIFLQRCEENEQHGRRLCMRIIDIPSQKNESAEDVRNSVKSIIDESGCDTPDIVFDRIHRIGKNDPSGKKWLSYCKIHYIQTQNNVQSSYKKPV